MTVSEFRRVVEEARNMAMPDAAPVQMNHAEASAWAEGVESAVSRILAIIADKEEG